jgi:hypothetical protein
MGDYQKVSLREFFVDWVSMYFCGDLSHFLLGYADAPTTIPRKLGVVNLPLL